MNKGKTWALAFTAFLLGLLLGWWLWHPAAGTVLPPITPTHQPALPLPTATVGDIRFTVYRAGKLQTRDESGQTHWLRNFEITIENLKNPHAAMDTLEIGPVSLFQEGKIMTSPVRSKMNDKFTLPPGLPENLSEDVRVVSCFQRLDPAEETASAGSDANTTAHAAPPAIYNIRFTFGPSQIPVVLGPCQFP